MYDFASLTSTQLERAEGMRRAARQNHEFAQLRGARTVTTGARIRSHLAAGLRTLAERLDPHRPTSTRAA